MAARVGLVSRDGMVLASLMAFTLSSPVTVCVAMSSLRDGGGEMSRDRVARCGIAATGLGPRKQKVRKDEVGIVGRQAEGNNADDHEHFSKRKFDRR